MKLVFGLYKYFPFGGLQRDMLAIARECAARGHQVQIFCQSWAGEYPPEKNIEINILPDRKRWWISQANHRKNARFAYHFDKAVQCIKPDQTLVFNKIPGADLYYGADSCFKAKLYQERPAIYRCLPRYRHFVQAETALFAPQAETHILAIAQSAIDEYRHYYQTPAERFTLLPPGISRDRINRVGERLNVLRKELHLDAETNVVLMIGSGFRTKGLDRAIDALVSLPETLKKITHLVVVGNDNEEPFKQQARKQGIENNVHFLGGRKDIPELLKSADLLVHPAYRETAGMVLLEAAVSGLPVLTTHACGYAHYIANNDMGLVLPLPFQQQQLNESLLHMLTEKSKQKQWRENGLRFAQTADIYDMAKRAVDTIERISRERGHG